MSPLWSAVGARGRNPGSAAAVGLCILVWVTAVPRAIAHVGGGIVVDAQERIYFVDFTGDRILRCDAGGAITTFADGRTDPRFFVPHHLTIDREGNIFTASDRGGVVVRIDPAGRITQLQPPPEWCGFGCIGGGGDPFTVDAQANVICLNSRQDLFSQILRVSPGGRIEVLVSGETGCVDGGAGQARIGHLHDGAFVLEEDGTLCFTDGASVRRLRTDGGVDTIAGSPERGRRDGRRTHARFERPLGLARDPRGRLVVADGGNRSVRLIDREGEVRSIPIRWDTLRDDAARGISAADAERGMRDFEPVGVAVGPSGSVFVLDYADHHEDRPRVSRIERDGRARVICISTPRPASPP